MSPHTRHKPAAPTGAEASTLYVAIEISLGNVTLKPNASAGPLGGWLGMNYAQMGSRCGLPLGHLPWCAR